MSDDEPQASAALAEAIRRFTDSHPNPCVDCLTRVYQAGVLDAADAANAEVQRLTAELALKDQALDEIKALHTEFRIYSECDCGHSDEAVLAGDAVDTGYFIACEETFEYAICAACCTADDEQTSNCASYHDHGKDEPICDTQRILTRLDTQGETK